MYLIRRFRESSASDDGSAVAEFVFTSMLVALVAGAIFQLAFALHARNTIIDSASEGARLAALEGSSLSAGIAYTRELITAALPSSYSTDISATVTNLHGHSIVEIEVRSPLPLMGFLGPQVITSTGRALME